VGIHILTIFTMEKFKQLMLSEEMLVAIAEAGFEEPSEIQEKAIPLVLQGKDVVGSSATGSGKTLAFGAGLIDKSERGAGLQTLIMTPTRELAEQVATTLRKFSRSKGLRVEQIYGGVGFGPQINNIRRADIVVGTPGRLLDHLKRGTLKLTKVKHLVLDEADRMLDMGFIKDVDRIISSCPNDRQTLLFSATMSKDVTNMTSRYMKNPVHFSAGEMVDASKLYQVYYSVTQDMKFSFLTFLLKREKNGVVMVFCNTRRNTDKLTRFLGMNGLHALAIHGGLSQNKRSDVMQAFHTGKTLILVCTDVAARGLDIKDVSHVYNYDIPKTGSDYIHRIGRTARAGKNGIAVSFVSSGDHGDFNQILKQGGSSIEKVQLPKFDILKDSFKSSGGSYQRGASGRFGGRGRDKGGRNNSRNKKVGGKRDNGRFGGGRSGGRGFGSRSEGGRGGGGRVFGGARGGSSRGASRKFGGRGREKSGRGRGGGGFSSGRSEGGRGFGGFRGRSNSGRR
jgi:superfamily II DNA/RNA helicase